MLTWAGWHMLKLKKKETVTTQGTDEKKEIGTCALLVTLLSKELHFFHMDNGTHLAISQF